MVVRFCTSFRFFFFIFPTVFVRTVSNGIDVIRHFIVIPTPTFAMSFQISSNNILTDTKNTIDNRQCRYSCCDGTAGGGCTRRSRVAEEQTRTIGRWQRTAIERFLTRPVGCSGQSSGKIARDHFSGPVG